MGKEDFLPLNTLSHPRASWPLSLTYTQGPKGGFGEEQEEPSYLNTRLCLVSVLCLSTQHPGETIHKGTNLYLMTSLKWPNMWGGTGRYSRQRPLGWQNPLHKSGYRFAVQRTICLLIYMNIFIYWGGPVQPTYTPSTARGPMWDGVRHCYILLFRFCFFTEDRVFWVGRSGVQQSSNSCLQNAPLTGHTHFSAAHTPGPPEKGLTFASAPKPYSVSFRIEKELTSQCCCVKKICRLNLYLLTMPHFHNRWSVYPSILKGVNVEEHCLDD